MSSPLPPAGTISHYRVVGVLGEGGMGCVYLAEDLVLGRRVALKLIRGADASEVMRQRLLREARAASVLAHANICTIYEAGVWEGEPFIAMQYVEGMPLTEARRGLSFDGMPPRAPQSTIARSFARSAGFQLAVPPPSRRPRTEDRAALHPCAGCRSSSDAPVRCASVAKPPMRVLVSGHPHESA